MLRIRDEQVQSLRKSLTEDVEDELFADVKQYFKERTTYISETQARVAVRHGMERAKHYGFSSLRGWALYVTLAFVLGSHFDKNPLYPWVHKNLVTDRDLVETTRTHRFYNALRRYLRATRDETNVYNEPILRYPDAPLTTVNLPSGTLIDDYLVEHLRSIAPAFFREAGDERVKELVQLAIQRAEPRRILSATGLSVYASLTFLLGVGFDEDPQFPWAAEACVPRDGDRIEAVADRLHDAALVFRGHTMKFVPPLS